MTFTNRTKNSSSFSNKAKNPNGLTFGDMPGNLLSGLKRTDVVLDDGTIFEDIKRSTSVPGWLLNKYIDTLWSNKTKHSSSFTNKTKH